MASPAALFLDRRRSLSPAIFTQLTSQISATTEIKNLLREAKTQLVMGDVSGVGRILLMEVEQRLIDLSGRMDELAVKIETLENPVVKSLERAKRR